MADPVEAIARELLAASPNPSVTSWQSFRPLAESAWAAGVEAVIAHEPCGGTNRITRRAIASDKPFVSTCPGPHTVIVKGDGTKLYADQFRAAHLRAWVGVPSDWRIE